MFLVFGLNGFLNFMPAPKDLPPDLITVSTGLMKGGYMAVVSATELVVALLLLTNRFVPLALVLLAPIVVGIITFHIAIAPATIGSGPCGSRHGIVPRLGLSWRFPSDTAGKSIAVPKLNPIS